MFPFSSLSVGAGAGAVSAVVARPGPGAASSRDSATFSSPPTSSAATESDDSGRALGFGLLFGETGATSTDLSTTETGSDVVPDVS